MLCYYFIWSIWDVLKHFVCWAKQSVFKCVTNEFLLLIIFLFTLIYNLDFLDWDTVFEHILRILWVSFRFQLYSDFLHLSGQLKVNSLILIIKLDVNVVEQILNCLLANSEFNSQTSNYKKCEQYPTCYYFDHLLTLPL